VTAAGHGPGRDRDDEHRGWDELAVGWALHALEPEDETAFAAHLAGCRRCVATVAETSEVMAAMAGELPGAEPSEGLRERLRAAVEETEQLPASQRRTEPTGVPAAAPPAVPPAVAQPSRAGGFPVQPPLPVVGADQRPAWRRVLPTALIAAAVAAVLSLGAWNVVVTSDRDAAQRTAAEQSQLLEGLLTPGRATIAPVERDGEVVATVVVRAAQVQVVATDLPVNDTQDETYVLWGVADDAPTPLGTFDVVTPAMDLRTVGSAATGLDDYSAYAISLEPGRQAPSSPTDIVAMGQVTS
jgi:anti-sigma factor RsiW